MALPAKARLLYYDRDSNPFWRWATYQSGLDYYTSDDGFAFGTPYQVQGYASNGTTYLETASLAGSYFTWSDTSQWHIDGTTLISRSGGGGIIVGHATAPITITVALSTGHSTAPIAITVQTLTGHSTAPITVDVGVLTGHSTAPIAIEVETCVGAAVAPVRVAVLDSLETAAWRASVYLAGVDVSAMLVGPVNVDAEEGSARLARFGIRPAAGVINPLAWVGQTVTIDLVRIIGGVEVPCRLFTGVVDMPAFDPVDRLVEFECRDDLQNVVARLTKAQIDALTGSAYSRGAMGTLDEHWDYAKALMETRQASLDASPHGAPRVTAWSGLGIWRTFTDDDVFVVDPITLPRRQDLTNQVEITYEYRYHRLRERQTNVTWSGTIIGVDALASGYQFPDLSALSSAFSALGWHVESSTYTTAYRYVSVAKPTGAPDGADSDWWVDNGGGGVESYGATLRQRHAQPVTETYTLTVSSPMSITNNGTLSKPLRGALSSAWSPSEWESDITQAPDVSGGDQDYSPDALRAESDAAIAALLAMAKTRIQATHRRTRQRFSLPCMPEIDLDLALGLDHPAVSCEGKVARVEHVLDPDAGEATTWATLALSGVAAGGVLTPDDLDPPAAPDVDAETGTDDWASAIPTLTTHVGAATISGPYSDALMGFLVNAPQQINYYNFTLGTSFAAPNGYYSEPNTFDVTGFRAAMPGVAASHRNPVALSQAASYAVAVPEDPLTLTA